MYFSTVICWTLVSRHASGYVLVHPAAPLTTWLLDAHTAPVQKGVEYRSIGLPAIVTVCQAIVH